MIFVFGSNKAGVHGAGAAKHAMNLGAKWGIGEGLVGDTYALPTKGYAIERLPLLEIKNSVTRFIDTAEYWYARGGEFQVTRVGTGLGGHIDADIAPMFRSCPDNCLFDVMWKPWLGDRFKYWGTYQNGKLLPEISVA